MNRLTWPLTYTLAFALTASLGVSPALAMFGLTLGDQRLFFLEPSRSDQDGQLDASLETQAPELEFEQFDGGSFGASYGASVLSSGEGVKARWDQYRFRAGVVPGPLKLLQKSLRFGFGIHAGAQLRFLRHFGSGREAATALPLAPWVLGSTDSILENMHPGDMASLPIETDLLLRASLHTPVAGIPVRPSLFFRIGGQFQMSLLRLPDHRVRLRFLSLKAKTVGAAVKAGFVWDADLIEVFGQKVRFLSEFNLFKAAWLKKWGDGVLFDTTLDLSDPEARAAFELLLYRPLKLVGGGDRLLSAGWSAVQALAERDIVEGRDQPGAEPRAILHRCGLVEFKQDMWKLKIGNSLLRWGRKDVTTVMEYAPYRGIGPSMVVASNLSVGKTTWMFRRESKWLFESQVFATEENDRLQANLWHLRYRVKDRRFSRRNLRNLRRALHLQLGSDRAPVLPDLPEGDAVRGKAEVIVRVGRRGLEELAAFSTSELQERWSDWMATLDPGVLWRQGHAFDMVRLPEELHKVLNDAVHSPTKKALETLAEFRDRNRAFGEAGPGFLLSLLQPTEDDARITMRVKYKSVATGNVKVKLGNLEEAPSEQMLPVMRFLETGVIELEHEASRVALEAKQDGTLREQPNGARKRASKFRQLHGGE